MAEDCRTFETLSARGGGGGSASVVACCMLYVKIEAVMQFFGVIWSVCLLRSLIHQLSGLHAPYHAIIAVCPRLLIEKKVLSVCESAPSQSNRRAPRLS